MTVVVVDDHPLLSVGLVQGLAARNILAVAIPPLSADRLMNEVRALEPPARLVVMDYAMPKIPHTSKVVRELASAHCPVLMLSGSEDQMALAECLEAGAQAVISKDESVETILDEIEAARIGQPVRANRRVATLHEYERLRRIEQDKHSRFDNLSQVEREVLALMMAGQSAATIADLRVVSMATVRTQIKAVLSKLGASSQLEAVAIAHRNGYEPTSCAIPVPDHS